MNPSIIMELAAARNQFNQTHPKFAGFISKFFRENLVQEGSIIEITVTKPDGEKVVGNMKVQASDMELLAKLKELGGNKT